MNTVVPIKTYIPLPLIAIIWWWYRSRIFNALYYACTSSVRLAIYR